jgi:site-specific DNA recombinase
MDTKIAPKTGNNPKVVIYVRVSTVEQAELGHSLEVQDKRLNDYATQNGWQVIKSFSDEGKSARTTDRPSFEALMDYCEDNKEIVDAILVQDTSRLCRNVSDHLEVKAFLKRRNIRLISLEGNNEDTDEAQFLDLITAGVNELESKRTGRKTKRVMVAMFEQGLKPGEAPIGYLNSFKKGVPMFPDPEKKYFIQEIFRMWNTGNYTLAGISDALYEKGFRSSLGKKVGKSSIQDILKRVDYSGGLSYCGQVNEHAQHKAIISQEDFERAQRMLKKRNRGANRTRKHDTLLAGIVYCFKCGSLMHGEYHEDGNYYRCSTCGRPYARMDYIDDAVSSFFKGSAFTEKGLAQLKEVLLEVKAEQGKKDTSQQRKVLEARRTALDEKMSKLEDKLLFGNDKTLDVERIRQKYEPLKLEMKQLEAQLKGLRQPSDNIKTGEIDKVIWGLGRMGDVYGALDAPQRKQFLKYFIKKVFVDCSENKIKNYELVEEFEALLSRDLVRITSNWLPRVDSNRRPCP